MNYIGHSTSIIYHTVGVDEATERGPEMISTPSEPVTSVIRKNMIDCRKGSAALIMVLGLIVLQLSCSPVSGAALKTASEAESNNSGNTTIATTEVAPTSSTVGMVVVDKGSTEKQGEEDDSRLPTIGRNHIYSSVREKTPGLPESCADYEVRIVRIEADMDSPAVP